MPRVPLSWIVDVVNEYGHRPREVAGESAQPYPAHTAHAPPAARRLRTAALVALAALLWPVFDQRDPPARAAALTGLLAVADLTPSVDADGIVSWSTRHHVDRETVVAGCAVALLGEIQHGGWHRLGTCDGTDCVDVYAHDRGRRRRYCSTTCLNRARIRAYRARGHEQ